jgi:gluconate 2-dehydrogenase gamma chain
MSLTRRAFVAYAVVPLRVLTADQAKLLEQICEQIIPADQDPGARDVGVIYFIDQQLAGPYKRFRTRYQEGLAAMPAQFLSWSFDQQAKYLQSIEKTPFFEMVIDHTMQGFYGSPRHGGNKGEASWKMLGINSNMQHGPHA